MSKIDNYIQNELFSKIKEFENLKVIKYDIFEKKQKYRSQYYQLWNDMFSRCYDSNLHARQGTYSRCEVCDEWNDFHIFKKWCDDNYYKCGNEKMELDKDIITKNNKIYSPERCIFVPKRINTLYVKSNKIRGEYPIGVSKHGNKYDAQVRTGGKNSVRLGRYDTPEEAFKAYKEAKEKYIKEIADIYNKTYSEFPQKLYNAMYNYCVDITD